MSHLPQIVSTVLQTFSRPLIVFPVFLYRLLHGVPLILLAVLCNAHWITTCPIDPWSYWGLQWEIIENKGKLDIVKIPSVTKCNSCIYSNSEHAGIFTSNVIVLIIRPAWHVMDDPELNLLICIEAVHTVVNLNLQFVFRYWLRWIVFKSSYELFIHWECVIMYTECRFKGDRMLRKITTAFNFLKFWTTLTHALRNIVKLHYSFIQVFCPTCVIPLLWLNCK